MLHQLTQKLQLMNLYSYHIYVTEWINASTERGFRVIWIKCNFK